MQKKGFRGGPSQKKKSGKGRGGGGVTRNILVKLLNIAQCFNVKKNAVEQTEGRIQIYYKLSFGLKITFDDKKCLWPLKRTLN